MMPLLIMAFVLVLNTTDAEENLYCEAKSELEGILKYDTLQHEGM
jgi:hypothetical protein